MIIVTKVNTSAKEAKENMTQERKLENCQVLARHNREEIFMRLLKKERDKWRSPVRDGTSKLSDIKAERQIAPMKAVGFNYLSAW